MLPLVVFLRAVVWTAVYPRASAFGTPIAIAAPAAAIPAWAVSADAADGAVEVVLGAGGRDGTGGIVAAVGTGDGALASDKPTRNWMTAAAAASFMQRSFLLPSVRLAAGAAVATLAVAEGSELLPGGSDVPVNVGARDVDVGFM